MNTISSFKINLVFVKIAPQHMHFYKLTITNMVVVFSLISVRLLTMNHDILLDHCGIRGAVLDLFNSYLNGESSKLENETCGVLF